MPEPQSMDRKGTNAAQSQTQPPRSNYADGLNEAVDVDRTRLHERAKEWCGCLMLLISCDSEPPSNYQRKQTLRAEYHPWTPSHLREVRTGVRGRPRKKSAICVSRDLPSHPDRSISAGCPAARAVCRSCKHRPGGVPGPTPLGTLPRPAAAIFEKRSWGCCCGCAYWDQSAQGTVAARVRYFCQSM